MSNQAIVILYTGKNIGVNPEVMSQIASILVNSGISMPEFIKIMHFDEDSVAKAIVGKSAQLSDGCAAGKPLVDEFKMVSVLEEACLYIANKFKDNIVKKSNDTMSYVNLMFNLRKEVDAASANINYNGGTDEDIKLITCIKIIGENAENITSAIRKKTGITNIAVQIIKRFYETNK